MEALAKRGMQVTGAGWGECEGAEGGVMYLEQRQSGFVLLPHRLQRSLFNEDYERLLSIQILCKREGS